MPMYDPPHPGEMIRDILEDEEVGWTVTECARRLGVARNTLSRLLHGRIGISPKMALALERAGWSSAESLDANSGGLGSGAGTTRAGCGIGRAAVRGRITQVLG